MNLRAGTIIVLTATLLLTMVVLLPRITEAERFKWFGAEKTASPNGALDSNPGQDRQDQKPDITVTASYQNDTSIPLRDMKPQPVFSKGQHEANENPKIPHKHNDSPDPVVQDTFDVLKSFALPNMPIPILNFNGIPFPGVACN